MSLPGCASGRVAPDAGLYTYELASSGPVVQTQVQSGWGGDSLYHRYSDLDVSAANGLAVSAVNRETPRPFHLFAKAGSGAWQEIQLASPPERELASWTRVRVMADGSRLWIGSVVRTNLSPMESSLYAGEVPMTGAVGSGQAGSYFPGFLFPDVLDFGCPEERGCAYAAGFVLGDSKDALGYKNYTVLHLRRR